MAVLPPMFTPAAAWRDLRAFLATRERHQLIFASLAVLMPTLILIGFYLDSRTEGPGPQTIYVQNYNGPRPDSVIVAQQKIDQAKKDALIAERRRQFQQLEKRLGM